MTRLIEILISLAIVAALFLIVGIALPSSRHLEHSVETNRKLTIVFDSLNSLKRFKDWNPLVLRDPRQLVQQQPRRHLSPATDDFRLRPLGYRLQHQCAAHGPRR